jgi:hypothetical protein
MGLIQKIHHLTRLTVFTSSLAFAAFSFFTPVLVEANLEGNLSTQELARRLEHNFWTDVENGDIQAFSRKISSIFQGGSRDGIVNQSQEIVNLISLDLNDFVIHDLIATQQHDVLVVSYRFDSIIGITLHFQNIISVWKLVGKHSRGSCDCSDKKNRWRLVSQSVFEIL